MYTLLIPMLLLTGSTPATAGGAVPQQPLTTQTTCPSDDRYVRVVLQDAISNPELRAVWGMGNVESTAPRLLTDERDAQTCQHFRDTVRAALDGSTSVKWGYYELDGFYFVTVHRVNERGDYALGFAAFWVFDSNLRQLGVWNL